MTPPGTFIWHELYTPDLEASVQYYATLFPWQIADAPEDGSGIARRVVQSKGDPVAALISTEEHSDLPPHWLTFVTVENVERACEAARGMGATVATEVLDREPVGRHAVLVDPQGAAFAVCEPNELPPPPTRSAPPAGTFCWHELLTLEAQNSADLYGDLFGFETLHYDLGAAGDYFLFRRGSEEMAGMMKAPPGAEHPAAWFPYVSVPNLDQAVEKVGELGGHIWIAPSDIPGVGRFSVTGDPRGAITALFHFQGEGKGNGRPAEEGGES